jgi:predicted metal-dependent enzyme (double-stranded beta helix superfamily)
MAASGERKLGGVGTKVLFENDRVKVWELALAPGETTDVHEHEHDYLLIQLEGDKIAGIFEDDTHGEYPPGIVEGDVSPGNVWFTTKGGIETAKNTGTQPYREILVELKD